MSKTEYNCFPRMNLFSVPAVLSATSGTASVTSAYIFIFLQEGRRQQAVLDKTFLTGLEKDNIRITWEEARGELIAGCDIKIDVTQVRSSPNSEIWLVFGLYFSSINTSFSQFQDVMLNSSKAKHMKFERLFNSSDITQTLNRENVQKVNQNSEGKLLDEERFEILESSIEIQEDELISFKLEEFVTAYDQSGLSLEDFLDTTPLLSVRHTPCKGCGEVPSG